MMTSDHLLQDMMRSLGHGEGPYGQEAIARAAIEAGRVGGNHAALSLFCDYFLKGARNVNYDMTENGEHWLLRRLAVFAPTVLFDVGANEGEWARAVCAALPDAQIHAFEIIPDTFQILSKTLSGNTRVKLNPFGLSDRDGVVDMHVFPSSNKVSTHIPYLHGQSAVVSCSIRCGDAYRREKNIEHIDFLKIDVEGAEFKVIQGFSDSLGEGRIDLIQFEYGKANIVTHDLLYDFYRFFSERGYAVGKIYPQSVDFRPYRYDDEDFLGPNYLACHLGRADIIGHLSKCQSG